MRHKFPTGRPIAAMSASQSRAAVSTTVYSTGCKSNAERADNLQHIARRGLVFQRFLKIARACLQRPIRLGAGEGDHRLLSKRLKQSNLAIRKASEGTSERDGTNCRPFAH